MWPFECTQNSQSYKTLRKNNSSVCVFMAQTAPGRQLGYFGECNEIINGHCVLSCSRGWMSYLTVTYISEDKKNWLFGRVSGVGFSKLTGSTAWLMLTLVLLWCFIITFSVWRGKLNWHDEVDWLMDNMLVCVCVCMCRFESTVQISKLQDLVNRSKLARCRGRFVCPVILYNGKVLLLSWKICSLWSGFNISYILLPPNRRTHFKTLC